MECSLPESFPSKRISAIEELIRGCQFANELRSLLHSSSGDDRSANDLVLKILSSFANSHTILSSDDFDVGSQLQPINTQYGSNSESSEESCKSISTIQDRRGRYRRRKNSQASTKDTATLMDDGYAWRKYGQKLIINAKYPRHYYRCTHKREQGCQAIKHVQRIQEDPPKYRTTSMGRHTCTTLNFPKAPEIIFELSQSDSRFPLISFDNTIARKENSFFSTFQSTKQEHKEDKPTNYEIRISDYQAPSYDYLMSPGQTTFNSFAYRTVLSECDIRDEGCDF